MWLGDFYLIIMKEKVIYFTQVSDTNGYIYVFHLIEKDDLVLNADKAIVLKKFLIMQGYDVVLKK